MTSKGVQRTRLKRIAQELAQGAGHDPMRATRLLKRAVKQITREEEWKVIRGEERQAFDEEVESYRQRAASETRAFEDVMWRALMVLARHPEKLDDCGGRDLAIIVGIMHDRLRLARGEATKIVDSHMTSTALTLALRRPEVRELVVELERNLARAEGRVLEAKAATVEAQHEAPAASDELRSADDKGNECERGTADHEGAADPDGVGGLPHGWEVETGAALGASGAEADGGGGWRDNAPDGADATAPREELVDERVLSSLVSGDEPG